MIDFVSSAAFAAVVPGPSAWVEAYGRLHMLVLHFPIALLIVAAGIELVRAAAPRRTGWGASISQVAMACAVFGGLAGALTASSGWIHADAVGATEDLTLTLHRWLGVVGASAGFLAGLLAIASKLMPGRTLVGTTRVVLIVGAIGVGAAGHFGGELVHGPGYLWEPLLPRDRAPEPAIGADPSLDPVVEARPVSFEKDVRPILESNCWRCHGSTRQRGDVRLDRLDDVLQVVTPGDVAGSPLAEVLRLPEDDDLHMPKNKPSLPEAKIATIERWIEEMGPSEEDVDAFLQELIEGAEPVAPEETSGEAPSVESPGANAITPEDYAAPEPAPWPVLDDDQRAARDEAIGRLREAGLVAQLIAADQDGVEVRLVGDRSAFGDEQVALLDGLEPALVVLDLTGSAITDEGLGAIGRYTRLRRLRVGETNVTDAGLAGLSGLDDLESLDLHMTGVTDEGVRALADLDRLSSLYVWRTKVTPTGAAWLRAGAPWLEVDLGD